MCQAHEPVFVQTYLLLRKARLPARNGLHGNYLLHPANNPALCLDVRNAGTTAGTVVIGWDGNGH